MYGSDILWYNCFSLPPASGKRLPLLPWAYIPAKPSDVSDTHNSQIFCPTDIPGIPSRNAYLLLFSSRPSSVLPIRELLHSDVRFLSYSPRLLPAPWIRILSSHPVPPALLSSCLPMQQRIHPLTSASVPEAEPFSFLWKWLPCCQPAIRDNPLPAASTSPSALPGGSLLTAPVPAFSRHLTSHIFLPACGFSGAYSSHRCRLFWCNSPDSCAAVCSSGTAYNPVSHRSCTHAVHPAIRISLHFQGRN